ncbi:MAG TPA: TOBE domain-containing protein, partial [Candidatus Lustribacter sp.]|nr:TOBE domain-containing protein [Candidatus Lustribacter sp.]
RVVQEGTPAEVARRPATDFVARLVGLNLYPGTLVDPVTCCVELDGGGVLYAAASGRPAPRAGSRMLVAVAPNAVSVHTHRPDPGSARNLWSGTVVGLELLAERVRVAVSGAPDVVVDVTAAAVAELALEPGRQVWLTAKATEVTSYPDLDTRP